MPEVKKRGNEEEIIKRDRLYMESQSLAAEQLKNWVKRDLEIQNNNLLKNQMQN